MAETSSTLAEAVSSAATGPGNPAHVRVSRPTSAALWCGIGALIVLGALACMIAGVFAFAPRPPRLEVWLERDHWLGWALIGSVLLLATVAIGIQWSRVSATGGPAHLDLEGRRDA